MRDEDRPTKEQYVRKLVEAETAFLRQVVAQKDDIVPYVLRFHLLAEQVLDRIISAHLARADRVFDAAALTFHQKLCLVHAFDEVADETVQALRQLNTLRNKCAHDVHKTILAADIDAIGRPYGGRYADEKRLQADRPLLSLFGQVFGFIQTELITIALIAEHHGKLPPGVR